MVELTVIILSQFEDKREKAISNPSYGSVLITKL